MVAVGMVVLVSLADAQNNTNTTEMMKRTTGQMMTYPMMTEVTTEMMATRVSPSNATTAMPMQNTTTSTAAMAVQTTEAQVQWIIVECLEDWRG